jgi:hypothetical protein
MVAPASAGVFARGAVVAHVRAPDGASVTVIGSSFAAGLTG